MASGIAVVAVGDHLGKAEGEAVGYFNHRRIKVGERLTIPDEKAFSKKWMERLTDKEAKQVKEKEADEDADSKRKNKKPVSVL